MVELAIEKMMKYNKAKRAIVCSLLFLLTTTLNKSVSDTFENFHENVLPVLVGLVVTFVLIRLLSIVRDNLDKDKFLRSDFHNRITIDIEYLSEAINLVMVMVSIFNTMILIITSIIKIIV